MNDEDLEVLITLDDPQYGPDEDTLHHLQPETGWPGGKKEKVDDDYTKAMLFAFI